MSDAREVPVFLSYAFRVFFLAAAVYAVCGMALWIAFLHGAGWAGELSPAWHAHEMTLGFAGAVIAGFLLTAVATWTGRPPVRGIPLAVLGGAWLAGRAGAHVGGPASALLDLLFPVLLAFFATREIVLGGSRRNFGIAAVTWAFVALTAVYHFGSERIAGTLSVHLVATLIALIGGRVIPSFTANWLRMRGASRLPVVRPPLDQAAIALIVVAGLADAFAPGTPATGALCLLAGFANLSRLAGWRGAATLANPLLWVLHLAFTALALGYVLLGATALGLPLTRSAALHLVTVGGIGGMILAMMTRVALGHTGRPLSAPPAIVLAYVLLAAAALVRSLGTAVPGGYFLALDVASLLWIVAFGLFLWRYVPILAGPRADAGSQIRPR